MVIYLENYKNAPLVLFFQEEDNSILKSLNENEKWIVGYPDKGIIWKSKTGKTVAQGENNNCVQINLNSSSIIEHIIKIYFNNKWKPNESSKSSYIVENGLKILTEIELRKPKS